MPEVFVQFAKPATGENGVSYRAQACGDLMSDGRWEGWIEFVPVERGTPIRSRRETTQPNRADTAYWATGLTGIYLEGALKRALQPLVMTTSPPGQPLFGGPAPAHVGVGVPQARPHAVLDPFSVYQKGEALLRQELSALSPAHLTNIIAFYRLNDQPATELNRMPRTALVDLVVTAVREQSLVP